MSFPTLGEFKAELIALRELRKKRLEFCNTCSELTSDRKCRACGCFVVGKVSIPNASCPLKKW